MLRPITDLDHGRTLHEAMLEGWPFTFVEDGRPLVTVTSDMVLACASYGLDPRAVRAIMAVERTPFPDDVVFWLEHPETDVRQRLREIIAEMERPRSWEEMKSNWDAYDRKLGEAYRLQSAHYALDEKVFISTPPPDTHRYGPHPTDPYAPGNRRRRR